MGRAIAHHVRCAVVYARARITTWCHSPPRLAEKHRAEKLFGRDLQIFSEKALSMSPDDLQRRALTLRLAEEAFSAGRFVSLSLSLLCCHASPISLFLHLCKALSLSLFLCHAFSLSLSLSITLSRSLSLSVSMYPPLSISVCLSLSLSLYVSLSPPLSL